MKDINMYINYPGQAEEAFNFYKQAFGAKITFKQTWGESPMGKDTPAENKNKIMHMSLELPNGTILYASDMVGDRAKGFSRSSNDINISIQADSKEEADNLFKKLSAGGKVTMPMADTFWNAYFGMFVDKFGIQWMINTEFPDKQ